MDPKIIHAEKNDNPCPRWAWYTHKVGAILWILAVIINFVWLLWYIEGEARLDFLFEKLIKENVVTLISVVGLVATVGILLAKKWAAHLFRVVIVWETSLILGGLLPFFYNEILGGNVIFPEPNGVIGTIKASPRPWFAVVLFGMAAIYVLVLTAINIVCRAQEQKRDKSSGLGRAEKKYLWSFSAILGLLVLRILLTGPVERYPEWVSIITTCALAIATAVLMVCQIYMWRNFLAVSVASLCWLGIFLPEFGNSINNAWFESFSHYYWSLGEIFVLSQAFAWLPILLAIIFLLSRKNVRPRVKIGVVGIFLLLAAMMSFSPGIFQMDLVLTSVVSSERPADFPEWMVVPDGAENVEYVTWLKTEGFNLVYEVEDEFPCSVTTDRLAEILSEAGFEPDSVTIGEQEIDDIVERRDKIIFRWHDEYRSGKFSKTSVVLWKRGSCDKVWVILLYSDGNSGEVNKNILQVSLMYLW